MNTFSLKNAPWEIWVVVLLLGFEGIGNLLSIAQTPQAAVWLLAKCIFIAGLLLRWKAVFIVFVLIAALHVLYFSISAPLVALINLIMIILVFCSFNYFWNTDDSNLCAEDEII